MTSECPFDRALALAALVRTLRDHFLDVRCGCGSGRVIPLGRMAADRILADRTLAHVALKLDCAGCFTGPDEVHLTETIFGIGPPPSGSVSLGWSVCLVLRSGGGARHLRRRADPG